MGEHIRKLENELRILHSCHSPDIHPLLSEELLRVKASVESERSTSRRSTSSDVDDRFLESFGTLAVSDGGTERFLGASGTTEVSCLPFINDFFIEVPFLSASSSQSPCNLEFFPAK